MDSKTIKVEEFGPVDWGYAFKTEMDKLPETIREAVRHKSFEIKGIVNKSSGRVLTQSDIQPIIYRGHANSDWLLQSTMERYYIDNFGEFPENYTYKSYVEKLSKLVKTVNEKMGCNFGNFCYEDVRTKSLPLVIMNS